MSHNSKYYRKVLPKNVSDNHKIDSFFSKSKTNVSSHSEATTISPPAPVAVPTQSVSDSEATTTEATTVSPSVNPPVQSHSEAISAPAVSLETSNPPESDSLLVKCQTENVSQGSTSDDDSCTSDTEDIRFPTPDQRIFSSSKYEQSYKWLYYSVSKMGYCCKMCDIIS